MRKTTWTTSAVAGFLLGLTLAVLPSCGGTRVCDASTCASGCCDGDGVCQPGSTSAACGTGARACAACSGSQSCVLGACQASGTGGGGGSTGGGTGTGGGTTGGGVGTSTVVVNEIASSDGDFFELFNTGTTAVDLSNFQVTDLDETTMGPKTGDALTLPTGTVLGPRGFLLFVNGATAGPSTSCGDATVPSCLVFTFGLSSSNGDAVFLLDPSGTVVAASTIAANAHAANHSVGRLPDGTGTFVETRRTPGLPNALPLVVDAGTTDAGQTDAGMEGDAGVSDAGSDDAGVFDAGVLTVEFNEVGLDQGDFIELKNVGAVDVDLGLWKLADLDTASLGPKLAEAVTLPPGVTVPAGGYLLFVEGADAGLATTCADAGVPSCVTFTFGLSRGSGDGVFLIDPSGTVRRQLDIPASAHPTGQSWSRIPDGTGSFVAAPRTMGAVNHP